MLKSRNFVLKKVQNGVFLFLMVLMPLIILSNAGFASSEVSLELYGGYQTSPHSVVSGEHTINQTPIFIDDISESFKFTAVVIGTVMFILGSTKAFGQLVTIYDIPESILNLFQGLANHPELVLLLIGIFYIFIGMWLESVAQIIIFTAVFLPLVTKLGIDPVVFGIFTVLTCEIGFLTPPIGINLFVAARITKVSIEKISIGVLPLLIPYILMVFILVFFSEWVTYLPDLVYGPSR
mgnify:CR=1 FL=1